MKYDLQLMLFFIALGLVARRLTWKGWFGVGMVIMAWMLFNIWKG